MKNSISLTIPSDMSHFPIVKSVIKKAAKKLFSSPEPVKELVAAVKELVENALDAEGTGIRIEINYIPGRGHFGDQGRLGPGGKGPARRYGEEGLND